MKDDIRPRDLVTPPQRRPYQAPTLVELGSVETLTATGKGMGASDGTGGKSGS